METEVRESWLQPKRKAETPTNHRADTVTIQTDDKNMNIEGSQGETYRNHDGLVQMPQAEAQKLIAAGVPGVRMHRKAWGGFGEGTLRKPYAVREEG